MSNAIDSMHAIVNTAELDHCPRHAVEEKVSGCEPQAEPKEIQARFSAVLLIVSSHSGLTISPFLVVQIMSQVT